MRRRADWLVNGRLDDLAADFVYPVPLEFPSDRLIVRTPDEGRALLGLWHQVLRDRGVVALQSKVIALDVPRRGRFRAWVDYYEVVPGKEPVHFSSVLYYCRRTPTGFRIEMASYPRLSLPDLQPQFAALALSA